MKKLLLFLPVLLVMLMTGCLKDNLQEGTIVLLGTESDVKPIGEVIPDTLLKFIMDADAMSPTLNLPAGNCPPDIQGEYVFSPMELYAYNADNYTPSPDDTLFFRFGGSLSSYQVEMEIEYHQGDTLIQGNDTLVFSSDTTIMTTGTNYYYPDGQNNMKVPCEFYGDVMEEGNKYNLKQTEAYVMGYTDVLTNKKAFSVYFTIDYDCEEVNSGEKYTLTRGYIITGVVTQQGIGQAVVACVNKEVKLQNTSSTVPPIAIESMKDLIYIYRIKGTESEPFGLAVRQQWVKP